MYNLKNTVFSNSSGNPDESQIKWKARVAGMSFYCPDALSHLEVVLFLLEVQ